jgi:hypothetical protein
VPSYAQLEVGRGEWGEIRTWCAYRYSASSVVGCGVGKESPGNMNDDQIDTQDLRS